LISYLTLQEIHDLMALPHFIKTAIVSLARRICLKEIQEFSINGFLAMKPQPPSSSFPTASASSPAFPGSTLKPIDLLAAAASSSPAAAAPPTASLPSRDSNGFRFLSFLRNYLSQPIQRTNRLHPNGSLPPTDAAAAENNLPFTEMEMDLLKYLPDHPTLASCPHPSSPAYRDWVSLTARHVVILMSRSSHCPSFIKPQQSMTQEIILKQLNPLLFAAEMTYADLEITTTGPSLDGRTMKTTTTTNVLSFGAGVPDGRASSLTWNVNGPTRDYQRPWIPSKHIPLEQQQEEGEGNDHPGSNLTAHVRSSFGDHMISSPPPYCSSSSSFSNPPAVVELLSATCRLKVSL
jgi:hypothetical protein